MLDTKTDEFFGTNMVNWQQAGFCDIWRSVADGLVGSNGASGERSCCARR